ncbi:hypothetical protein GCM10008014_12480 [Paenibacillus silvae]|uniref:Uncharacterized protein n=1 Tax=Paenibacillus silvae TaxID=1325358 RepID=A0ABQ1Z5C7_9BACL|nr:hypothetical protein [Paenibacillus silvae]GGH48511.1 hypothetical protein GCM10008014_12480 [Paenibacillus silvae]
MKKRRKLLTKVLMIVIFFCLFEPFLVIPSINKVSYATASQYGSIEIEGMYTVVESDGVTIRIVSDPGSKGYIDYTRNYQQYHYMLTDNSMTGTKPIRLISVDKISNKQFVIHYTRKDGSLTSRTVSFDYVYGYNSKFVSYLNSYGEIIDTDGTIYKCQLVGYGDLSLFKNGKLIQSLNILTDKELTWFSQLVQKDFYIKGNQFMVDIYYEGENESHYNRSASIGTYTAPVFTNPLVIILSQTPDTSTNGKVTVKVSTNDNSGTVISTKFAVGNQPVSYFESAGTVVTGNSFMVETNNTYTVYVEDNIGNKKIQTINISNIDVTPPADATFSARPDKPMSSNLRVIITYPNDARIREYSLDYVTWMEYNSNTSIVIPANANVFARSKDAAGNVSNVTSYKVNKFVLMHYDSAGRIDYIQLHPSGEKYKYIYDRNGNLLSIQRQ